MDARAGGALVPRPLGRRSTSEGTGYGTWHWGLAADETPAPDKKPDATITGRAVQFALVAARRLTADEVLDAGNLVVGGDAALGETILRHIRCYP